jgi:arylsulfatase A-like enzyme
MLACGGAGESAPPNVVVIVLEAEDSGHAETPHMSRFAAQGVFYPAAFAHSPEAEAARLALLSARTPIEAGLLPGEAGELPELGSWLVEHGYRTTDAPTEDGPFFLLATYAGTHAQVDVDVGRLLTDLEERGLFESALIVLTSHRSSASSLSDVDLRAPVILKLPYGHRLVDDFDRTRDKSVRHIDVVPTVLDVLGLPKLPGATGTSLLEGTLRVLLAEAHEGGDRFCLRDDTYKLIYHPATGAFEMYDLAADPGETTDVFAEKGDERAPWKRALAQSGERLAELRAE